MTAARHLTDADVEAIAEAVASKLGRRVAKPEAAPVLSKERREAVLAKARGILKRRGIRSEHGSR